MDLQTLLEKSASQHSHLCPRQVLGVRIGVAGISALGFPEPPAKKRLLVISESDGCFIDGLMAATGCTPGHRTLRMEDYGKIAATFIDTVTGRALRVVPARDIRQRAHAYARLEPRHYFAQLQAYRAMPETEMFTVVPVALKASIEAILSRPAARASCDRCGEEIINEREVVRQGMVLCRACAGAAYYEEAEPVRLGAHCIPRMTLNSVSG